MKRQALLDNEPASLGTSWAHSVCEKTRIEGRVVAGGWPGTLLEARARVHRYLNEELARRRMPELSIEELSLATNATYSQAKKEWLGLARTRRLEARARAEREE